MGSTPCPKFSTCLTPASWAVLTVSLILCSMNSWLPYRHLHTHTAPLSFHSSTKLWISLDSVSVSRSNETYLAFPKLRPTGTTRSAALSHADDDHHRHYAYCCCFQTLYNPGSSKQRRIPQKKETGRIKQTSRSFLLLFTSHRATHVHLVPANHP